MAHYLDYNIDKYYNHKKDMRNGGAMCMKYMRGAKKQDANEKQYCVASTSQGKRSSVKADFPFFTQSYLPFQITNFVAINPILRRQSKDIENYNTGEFFD
ncbi:hypothetical protein L484_020527 [Morus notabilis]|uniref:Uncharacterized protein n=1 Tax=Morus notabilis TaxID=981085 RepID=W9S0L8_9ROSA|nr:hypothetical protein L484_020527 [Morus notabilis]